MIGYLESEGNVATYGSLIHKDLVDIAEMEICKSSSGRLLKVLASQRHPTLRIDSHIFLALSSFPIDFMLLVDFESVLGFLTW